jgi:outer membrane lipoprotein-sorting protein
MLKLRLLSLATVTLISQNLLAQAVTSDKLLQDAARGRGLTKQGVTWELDLNSVENGKTTQVKYNFKAKGENALLEALSPAEKKGQIILFKDKKLWFLKPGVKKPVAISSRQSLMGQTANADIAAIDYTKDYNSKMLGEEKVDGKDTYKLELTAKDKSVAYSMIRVWISKDDHLAIKAEYYGVSGEVSKTALMEYKNSIKFDGKSQPFLSTTTIVAAQNKDNRTVITYINPRSETISDDIFSVNNLIKK